jgi:hypothetical protein
VCQHAQPTGEVRVETREHFVTRVLGALRAPVEERRLQTGWVQRREPGPDRLKPRDQGHPEGPKRSVDFRISSGALVREDHLHPFIAPEPVD